MTGQITSLYFAYGSNLHLEQMSYRCPDAKPITAFELPGWRLSFKGVADVERDPQATCLGAIYEITEECEAALDVYEGFRPGNKGRSGLYRKEYVPIRVRRDGKLIETDLMLYAMNRGRGGRPLRVEVPHQGYFDTIRVGFENWDLDDASLWDALDHAYEQEDLRSRAESLQEMTA